MTTTTGDKPKPGPRVVTARPPFKGCNPSCACKCGNQHCACHDNGTTTRQNMRSPR